MHSTRVERASAVLKVPPDNVFLQLSYELLSCIAQGQMVASTGTCGVVVVVEGTVMTMRTAAGG